jgi:hypothetical protein
MNMERSSGVNTFLHRGYVDSLYNPALYQQSEP